MIIKPLVPGAKAMYIGMFKPEPCKVIDVDTKKSHRPYGDEDTVFVTLQFESGKNYCFELSRNIVPRSAYRAGKSMWRWETLPYQWGIPKCKKAT